MAAAALAPQQMPGRQQGQGARRQHAGRQPAQHGAFDQHETQARQRRHAQRMAEQRQIARLARRRHQEQLRHDDGQHAQRHVDPEDAAPAELVHEDAADQGAGRTGHAHQGRPGTEHARALALVVKAVREQAERTGHEQGRARALQQARRRQEIPVGRGAAQHRAEQEDAQAALVHGFRPVAVGQRAAGQQQRGERQGVAIDHPDQARQRNMQVQRDIGQRHVDGRDVEHGHDEAEGQGQQDQAAGAAWCGGNHDISLQGQRGSQYASVARCSKQA